MCKTGKSSWERFNDECLAEAKRRMNEDYTEGPAPVTKQAEMKAIKEKSGDQESTDHGSSHLDEDVSMRSELESKIGSPSCIFYEEDEFEVTRIVSTTTDDSILSDLEKKKVRVVRKMSSMSDYDNDVNADATFELSFDQQQLSKTTSGRREKEEEPLQSSFAPAKQEETVKNQPKVAHVQPLGDPDRELQVTGFMVFGDQETMTMY